MPAIYEVFGDKAGLVREIFFEGFRMLGDELAEVPVTKDPLEDLRGLCESFRGFVLANPVLALTIFARPFADFDPTTEDDKAGAKVRKVFVKRVRSAVDAGLLVGDPIDIAQVLFAFVEGLSAAESAGRFGTSKRAVDRRWRLGLDALVTGLGAK